MFSNWSSFKSTFFGEAGTNINAYKLSSSEGILQVLSDFIFQCLECYTRFIVRVQ